MRMNHLPPMMAAILFLLALLIGLLAAMMALAALFDARLRCPGQQCHDAIMTVLTMGGVVFLSVAIAVLAWRSGRVRLRR